MHEHFDVDGNLTGTTVVTRESLWDEATRGRVLRLAEHERSIDKASGLPMEDAYTKQPFMVHNDLVNYALRAIDHKRELDKAEALKRGVSEDDHAKWSEHRTYYARTVDPDDLPTPD